MIRTICGKCNDTGIIVIIEEGMEIGRKCPDCSRRKIDQKFFNMVDIGKIPTRNDLDVKFNGIEENLKEIDGFKKGNGYLKLFFVGPPGTGKTIMAIILLYELMIAGNNCFYTQVKTLKKFNSDFQKGDEDYDYHKKIYRSKFLFIDDIGKETESSSFDTFLSDLIEHRDNNKFKTIITSEYNPKDDDNDDGFKYTERTISRLCNYTEILCFCCTDFRKIKK